MTNKALIGLAIATVVVSVVASLLLGGTSTIKEITNNVGENLGAVSNIYNVGPELGINGLQTRVVAGEFTHNGTSTIADFRNPFAATATIDFFTIRNVGVSSSTYNFECGTMTSSTTNTFARRLLAVGTVATSTNFGVVTNLMATSSANLFGSMDGTVGAGEPINIGAGDLGRFKCIATHPTGYDTQRIATSTPNATFKVTWRARVLFGQ